MKQTKTFKEVAGPIDRYVLNMQAELCEALKKSIQQFKKNDFKIVGEITEVSEQFLELVCRASDTYRDFLKRQALKVENATKLQ